MSVFVKSQSELDAALAAGESVIDIVSERGVWLEVSNSGSATVRASGSATVRASDSATVSAYDSATVRAYDSATVSAYDSATVRAYDSATVSAYDSATVSAYDSATVSAYDSATVRAGTHVAVHLHSKRVTLDGGVVIDVTDLDLEDPTTWCGMQGAKVADGKVTLYKAVSADLEAGHSHIVTAYPIGETVTAPNWKATTACGNGLHFCADPVKAESYYSGPKGVRYLEVTVDLADMIPLGDKVKAPSCTVIREVDAWCRPATVKVGVSA